MNRTIFVLTTFCGLRVSELCGLVMRDFSLHVEKCFIRIRAEIAKGHQQRIIPLWKLPVALGYVNMWHSLRLAGGAGRNAPFVCTIARDKGGRHLNRRNARRRWIRCCRVLGKERQGQLTIHDGRHTAASHLLAGGWPLAAVRDLLGHASISTTSVYTHVVVDSDVPDDPFQFAAQE
ncbi:Tyrosine recombinase XerC [subsurface metagenome]